MTNNPYAQAAGAYGDHSQKHTPDQRELEARVLLKSAKMLQDLSDGWGSHDNDILQQTLRYNRQIWMMFYDTACENKDDQERPDDLRSNIINLANFVFKRETEILAAPEKNKLDVLININREIASGLMTQQKNSEQNRDSEPAHAETPEKADIAEEHTGGFSETT